MGHLNLPQRIHGKPKEESVFDGAVKNTYYIQIGKHKIEAFEYTWKFPICGFKVSTKRKSTIHV